MPTLIRSSSLTNYVEIAREVGLDPYALLRRARIDTSALLDPDLMISATAVMRLLENSARRAGVEDFGLRMAETRRLENLGPLALVLREEPTLRKALESLARHVGLHNESTALRIEDADDVTVLKQVVIGSMRGSLRQSVELLVCVLYRVLRLLLGPDWKPQSICFSHGAPKNQTTHRRVFGMPVLFDMDFDGVVLASADLDFGLPSYDPVLAPRARHFLNARLAQSEAPMPDKVRKLVLALLPTGECDVERVARQLGIDRKTLFRHLGKHGQTYSTIVEEVRGDLVTRYVENSDRPLSNVAALLGFSSLSAFSRWFAGRFERSATQWRAMKLHAAGSALDGTRRAK